MFFFKVLKMFKIFLITLIKSYINQFKRKNVQYEVKDVNDSDDQSSDNENVDDNNEENNVKNDILPINELVAVRKKYRF